MTNNSSWPCHFFFLLYSIDGLVLPLQSFSNLFDLLILLAQDLLHVAVCCGLLELLLQLLETTHMKTRRQLREHAELIRINCLD